MQRLICPLFREASLMKLAQNFFAFAQILKPRMLMFICYPTVTQQPWHLAAIQARMLIRLRIQVIAFRLH